MTHPVLRTSTALGLSLSLLQPGVAPAQEAVIDPDLRALCAESPEAEACAALPEEVLQQILDEAGAAEETPPPEVPAEEAPADDSAAPPDADPEPAPETLQDAPAEIVPGSTPPEPRPEAPAEEAPEEAPTGEGVTADPDAAEAAPGAPDDVEAPAEAAPAEDEAAPEAAVPEEPEPATEALEDGLDALEAETPEAGVTAPESASEPAVEPVPEAATAPEPEAGTATEPETAEPDPATDTGAAAETTVPEEPEPATEALEDGLDALEAETPEAGVTAPESAAEPAVEPVPEAATAPEPEAGTATEPGTAEPDPATDTGAAAETTVPEEPEPATEALEDGLDALETTEDPAAEAAVDEEEPLAPLDAEQEAAIEAMSADPEMAESLSVLEQTLAAEDEGAEETGAPAAAAAVEGLLADPAAVPEAETREVTGEMSRTSAEDVAEPVTLAAPTEATPRERDGLTDFEQIGLGALAGLVVGMTVANNRVAATAPDRVVVVDEQGDYEVWRDDDALLRRPGVRDRIERFDDGSTVSTIFREDGARIVTVRDATGRAIRRDRIAPDGRVVTLFDDTRRAEPVRISALPAPRQAEIPAFEETDPDLLRRILAETVPAEVAGRFTLAQVRRIVEVRRLAPELAVGPVTFATGSAAIRPEQAQRLAVMAGVMNDIIDLDPSEVFLIEGHTDAVGRRAYNLLLSDRRAESVALALAEYFDVPPENMVVQGYGERFLRVPTARAEPRNRRVTVRRVTDLIR